MFFAIPRYTTFEYPICFFTMRNGCYCMNIPTACINTGMYLHSEVPFIALLCLMHFRITFALLILSGFWCCYKACINNSATMHHKTGFIEAAVDISKKFLARLVCFKHMSELKQGSRIRYLLFMEIYMHKGTHSVTVVDRILDSFIGQNELPRGKPSSIFRDYGTSVP